MNLKTKEGKQNMFCEVDHTLTQQMVNTTIKSLLQQGMPSFLANYDLKASKYFNIIIHMCVGTIKVYMTDFLFARLNLPNVLISAAKKFFP